MNITPGHLYFINEQDVFTGEHSTYFKIGIVRSSEKRDTKDRLLEHQTGNPRKLCTVFSREMDAVEAVETNLHYLFARNRVMGEWMNFTESELAQAIAKAEELAARMPAYIEEYQKSEALQLCESNGVILQQTDESRELFAEFLNFEDIKKYCTNLEKMYKENLKSAVAKGLNVGGKAYIQHRRGAQRFDEKLFATNFPDLYKKYTTRSSITEGPFTIMRPKQWIEDLSVLDQEQIKIIKEMENALENQSQKESLDFGLHAKHLGVIEVLKYAEWKVDFAKTKLKVLTGLADGIEGICSWKRETIDQISFDKEKVKQEHPEEYNQCVTKGPDVKAFIVESKNVL